MKNYYYILIASIILSLTCAPMISYAMPEPVPATQTDKQKAAAAKKKEAEKKKKAAEKAKAAKTREKEKAAKAKETEKAKAAAAKANEKKKEEAAKAQAQREQERAKKEAEAQAKEEKAIREYEKYQESLANPKTEAISYINLGLRGGYAAMMDKISKDAQQQLKGGGGAGLNLTYGLEYGHFLFETGLDFRFLNSSSTYGFTGIRQDMSYPYDANGTTLYPTYYYMADNMKETRNMAQIGVPIMFGAQFSRYYFLLGAKVGYTLFGNYSHSGKYDIWVDDPALLDPYGLGIHDFNMPTGQPITFKHPEVSLAAEIGIDLDEWMQAQPKAPNPKDKKKKQVKPGERLPFGREHVHYRLALFAEYGILNTNGTPAAKPLEFIPTEIPVQKTNTMLAMNGDTKLNNLFVGVKFTIQFEIPGKTARPVPAPPAYAMYSIIDADTHEPLPVALVETRGTESGKIAMKEKQIGPKGFRQKHALGSFTVDVKADGYYPASQTFSIENVGTTEDVVIALHRIPEPPAPEPVVMPVEKGEVFIIKNLHFATNKTRILSSSEEALNALYQHLDAHPEIRIKIIGHTDSVGRDAANMKLSEGRANEVRKDLIERGIAPERLEAEGRGESQPIDTNDTEEGRQNNRRVEIEIL